MPENTPLMRHRWVIVVALAMVAAVVLTSWMIQYRMEIRAEKDTEKALFTVVDLTRQAIRSWVKEQKSDAEIWVAGPEVRRYVADLLAGDHDPVALARAPAQAALRNWLSPVRKTKGYLGFFVIGPDGINLASTRDINLGVHSLLLSQAYFLTEIRSGRSAMSLPQTSDVPLPDRTGQLIEGLPTMFVGAPVRDDAGKVIAILAFRIDPTTDFSDILQRGRLGTSGETYAFDHQGRMLSESRFKQQLVDIGLLGPDRPSNLGLVLRDPGVDLNAKPTLGPPAETRPLTRMTQSAIAGDSGVDVDGYRDYRGVSVVGAWVWDETLQMGLASEVDVAEAYSALAVNKLSVTLGTVFMAILVATLAALFASGQEHKRTNQELTSRRALLRDVLETVGQGIVMFDAARRLTIWNQRFQYIFEYPDGFLRPGLPIQNAVTYLAEKGVYGDGNVEAIVDRRLEFLWDSGTTTTEIVTRGNTLHEVLIRHRDDGGLVITYTDITAREQIKAEVAAQRDKLDLLNQQKDRLFSIIGHDLKNPLNAMIGFSELIANKSDRLSQEKVSEYARMIYESANALYQLLEELLAWSRSQMESIRYEPSAFHLPEIVKAGTAVVAGSAKSKGVALIVEVPDVSVMVDRDMIVTVIRNIASNAIKFTHAGGRITVTAAPEGASCIVSIADTGIGMTADQIEDVLGSDAGQSTIGTGGESGVGLGLLLCKEFLQKHDSAIEIESAPSQGSTFRFALPIV